MTKTEITGALLGANAVNGLAQGMSTPNVSRNANDISFADALSQTSSGTPQKSESLREPAASKTIVSTDNNPSANIKKEANNTKDISSLDESGTNELAENTVDKAEKIISKIEDELSVSEDDVKEAMEVLALTMTDLFDPSNLQNLVMEITGTEDVAELLTDVDLYSQLKEITGFADEMLSELSSDMGIETEQLLDFVTTDESFKNVIAEVIESDDVAAVNADALKDTGLTEEIKTADENITVNDDTKPAAATEKAVEVIEPEEDKEEKTDNVNLNQPAANKEAEEVKTNTVKIEITGSKADNNKNDDRAGQEGIISHPSTMPAPDMVADNIISAVESYTDIDAEDVFRQVTDFVKVNITEESTSMEMQLHPASLGTVNMQINSANGQITAHLTVQNELVKSVLEGQLIQLQQTFEEQGTKVEAIEVTVANYNLDSGMNNNTENNEGEGRRGSGTRRRNINLSVDSGFEEFTDEEKLMAEVMDMNGNSVDFTA